MRFILAALFSFLLAAPAWAQKPPDIEVMRASAGSLYVNITLIKGEKKAVLVDAPFTRADAHRAVAMVLDSGKELETIFITHDHPDHFFALEVLVQAFPNVKVVAAPTVSADIWRSLPLKVKRWVPVMGENAPKSPTAPSPLTGDSFELEGHVLKVIGPMQGDHVHASALWIPDAKALIAGDLLFNEVFVWLGEHGAKERKAWLANLDRLEALGAEIVVAGHANASAPNDRSAFTYTRGYLKQWEQDVKTTKNAQELAALVKEQYPNSVDVLGDFILGTSARVSKGEEPRWTE